MQLIECSQLDDVWWSSRCGVPTASQFGRIFQAGKKKLSTSIDGYIEELIGERRCHTPPYFSGQGKPVTPAMQRGTDLEPVARSWYEQRIKRRTWRPGFCLTDDGRFGCSPDFLVGEEGCGEIKIFEDAQHAKWVKAGVLPTTFACQVWGQLFVCGRPWVDLVLWSETQESTVIRTEAGAVPKEFKIALEQFWERYQGAAKRAGL